jgi:UDP:flavonoid glycosyltransferase YjiC (YdhE family)
MRAILTPVGSSGDVLPFVALGAALRRRGCDVHMVVTPYFQRHVEAEGLTFHAFGTTEQYLDTARDPKLWHPTQGLRVVATQVAGPAMVRMYEQVAELVKPRETIVVGSILALGSRLLHDSTGVPFVTVHLQPSVLRSVIDPPSFGFYMPRSRWGRKLFFKLADWLALDRYLRGPINAERRRLGLPPIARVEPWWHSPQRVVCLFPRWFAPPAPDWPPQVVQTGFPLADGGKAQPLTAELSRWLDAGEPPVVATFGSAMMHADKLFAASIEACGKIGQRVLLLTPFAEQLPAELPPHAAHFDYAPFRSLFPRAAAIIHHGGIGTTSQCLAAGRPQLIVPHSHDQPDNALRVQRLNAGLSLKPGAATPRAMADAVRALLNDSRFIDGAAACAQRIGGDGDAVGAACDHILAFQATA